MKCLYLVTPVLIFFAGMIRSETHRSKSSNVSIDCLTAQCEPGEGKKLCQTPGTPASCVKCEEGTYQDNWCRTTSFECECHEWTYCEDGIYIHGNSTSDHVCNENSRKYNLKDNDDYTRNSLFHSFVTSTSRPYPRTDNSTDDITKVNVGHVHDDDTNSRGGISSSNLIVIVITFSCIIVLIGVILLVVFQSKRLRNIRNYILTHLRSTNSQNLPRNKDGSLLGNNATTNNVTGNGNNNNNIEINKNAVNNTNNANNNHSNGTSQSAREPIIGYHRDDELPAIEMSTSGFNLTEEKQ